VEEAVRLTLGAIAISTALMWVSALADDKHDNNRGRRAIPCAALLNLHLANTTITSAESVPAGSFDPPGATLPFTDLPEFCRVVGSIKPVVNSEIGFEVWMPADWNGKFNGVGSGGSAGAIQYASLRGALLRGYAAMATDNGHVGSNWNFANPPTGDPEKVIDFGYRAQHLSTAAAKSIVRAFYGERPKYSYFTGCSQGGHHGLMEAQRFPEDYDGIVAGDPAHDWTNLMVAELWTGAMSTLKGPASDLPQAKLNFLHNAVLQACDANDGVLDGVLENPRTCKFNPAVLQCQGPDSPTCLTAAQLEAVRLIYQGPRNPRTSKLIFPGLPVGSEEAWRQVLVGQPVPGGSSNSFFRDGVFNDPNWDPLSFNYDTDTALTQNKPAAGETWESALDADSADLRGLKSRGAKLIMYHGLSDPFITPWSSTDYYERVIARFSGRHESRAEAIAEVQDFARLFLVPGLYHCVGGPGATTFDMLSALEEWVEKGEAPKSVIASRVVNNVVERTRPLCAYPRVATYKGSGDTNDAESFRCRLPASERARRHDD